MRQRHPKASLAAALVAAAGVVTFAATTRADDTIKHPGDHPQYSFEAEPHLILGWGGPYAANEGYGIGVRVSIPLVDNGFISSINNSVAISFGADLVHYDWCWYGNAGCSANYLDFPVVMQWNFFVAQRWSVFGEPGLYVFDGFFNDCPNGNACPGRPWGFGIEPALYLGGRYHLSSGTALTMRIGFPSFSFGFSFFP